MARLQALGNWVRRQSASSGRRVWGLGVTLWPWIFLLCLVAYFSIVASGFLTLNNFQSIGVGAGENLILALGETFVIISGGIDLSAGYVMGLASVVPAVIMRELYPSGMSLWVLMPLATGAGLGVAVLAGSANGLIIARLKVPSFIATLGMLGICRGLALVLSGGPPVGGQPPLLGTIGNGYLMYYSPDAGFSFLAAPVVGQEQVRQIVSVLPNVVTIAAIVVLVCWIILSKTVFGQHTFAVGGNLEAARRSGIQVERHLIKVYAFSGLMAGIGGQVYLMRFTSGSAIAGEPLLLTAIAAVVIGGASLFGGEGTIWGTLIGALIIAVMATGFVIQGINPFYQFVAVGIVIIGAVLIDQFKSRLVVREGADRGT
jgi:ribose/xylose/arabinose/galactoside ABC-type transport system permease subunit